MVTISQKGQTAQSNGRIILSYIGTLPAYDYVGRTFYLSTDDTDTAQIYQEAGIIDSVEDGIMVIDLNNLSNSDIDRIYNDLYNGDMIEMDEIFFGISPSNNPAMGWKPVLMTTAVGSYTYTSQYVANMWKQAYAGNDKTIECNVLNGGVTPEEPQYTVNASFSLAELVVANNIFDGIGQSQLFFYARLTTEKNKEIDSVMLEVKPSTIGTETRDTLWCEVSDWTLPEEDSLAKIDIFCKSSASSDNYSILEGEISTTSSCTFTNTQKPFQSYSSVFDDGTQQTLGFIFSGTNRIPLVGKTDGTTNTLSMSSTLPTITITNIGIRC